MTKLFLTFKSNHRLLIFLLISILFVNSVFSQSVIHKATDKHYLQFELLESQRSIGKYVMGNTDSLGFSVYQGKKIPNKLPAQNRMLTLRASFIIDSAAENEEWALVFPPVFYVCNIYLNGRLIAMRGDTNYGYSSRNHTTASYLLSHDLLNQNKKINTIAIELLPRYGEINSVPGIFISSRRVGETYAFWRNLFSIDFIKAMLLTSFIIFLYFLIFSFQRKSKDTGYYLPFSLLCLFYPLAYLNNVFTFNFVDTLMLEKVTRLGTTLWTYFALFYLLEFTKITKYKNNILIGLGIIYIPFIVLGWLPDTVPEVVDFNLKYTSILNIFVIIAAIGSSFIYAYRIRTKYAYILAFVYLLVIPSIIFDLYYSIVLQYKPYVLLLPYMMFLTIVVFFFIVSWQQSSVYKLALKQAGELKNINENLEKLVEERTLKVLKLSKAVEQSPTTIVITDTKGNIEYANPKFTELTGYTIQEAIGKNPNLLKSGKTELKIYKDLWQTIKAGKIWQGEFINKKKNGELFIENSVIAPIFDNKGTIINYVAIKIDITERKNAEAEINRKNAELQKLNTEKDKFFSIIAHDLRGPFNGFLGLTEIMAEKLSSFSWDEIQEIAVNMRNSSKNLSSLLENLLHWARMQQGLIPFNKELVVILPIATECVEMLKESFNNKEIEISVNISDQLEVYADIHMLQTVIRNLLSNAVKFTHKGGKISILANAAMNNSVEISIIDSGIGMSRTIIDNLFRLDVKTNREGTDGEPSTGLGLLLCKEFVEKHGGKLWVESEEGKGSTFYFTLPCCKRIENEGAIINDLLINEFDNQNKQEVAGLKILIVDDEIMSAALISKVIKIYCRDLLKAKTGGEAIEICRNNPDLDLILMDMQMPGIDGYEATKQIRKFNPDVIIIAQTATILSSDLDLTIRVGCNEYISKPINKDHLFALVQKYFGNKKVESEIQNS